MHDSSKIKHFFPLTQGQVFRSNAHGRGYMMLQQLINNKQQQEATYNNIEQQNQRTQMGEGFWGENSAENRGE